MNVYMLMRNKGKLGVLFLTVVLFACMIVLLEREKTINEAVETPKFSRAAGFYQEEFYLTLEAEEDTDIYYTLDGSFPDATSYKYQTPICIVDASTRENLYAARTDTSAGFYTELIKEYETRDADPLYNAPDFLVDKCTVIRAVAINKYGVASEVATETYFVGIAPEQYDGCNILSLITEPENFFGEETGIYVTGKIFEEYLAKGEMDDNWRFWESNYTQRGKQWEREAVFQFFDNQGNLLLSKNGGVRTRGGVSRGTLPRGLNLYAREEYDKEKTFGVTLFGNEFDPQSISLTSGGNQITTQFSDYMMAQRTQGLNYATMNYEPYVMFLNGEYWGFYWLAEKYDEGYLEYYYKVDPSQVIMVKNGELEIGEDKDILFFNNTMAFIANNDMSMEDNYNKAQKMIDIESCLDYYATMIYIGRSEDWPGDNFAMWRTREVGESEYADTKWRWMLFDCNSASMRNDKNLVPHDTLNYVIQLDSMFASLWKNTSFREKFEERILYLADNCFDGEEMNRFILDYKEEMVPVLSKTWARFHGSENSKLEEYYDRMESYRVFFENRRKTVESWFDS